MVIEREKAKARKKALEEGRASLDRYRERAAAASGSKKRVYNFNFVCYNAMGKSINKGGETLKKRIVLLVSLVLSASLLLAGCGDEESSNEGSVTSSFGQLNNSQNVNMNDQTSMGNSIDEVPDYTDDSSNSGTDNANAGTEDYSTIEEYFTLPSIQDAYQTALNNLLNNYSDVYSAITYEATGNDVVYNYYYVPNYLDIDTIYNNLAAQDYETMCKTGKQNLANECGITPTSFTYAYYASDGTCIFSWTE